jgi:hypothetical protein
MATTVSTSSRSGRFAGVSAAELADTIEQRWAAGEQPDWDLVFGLLERVLDHEDPAVE